MAVFYFGAGFKWLQWLEMNSFTADINKTIQKTGKQQSYAISKQTREIMASNESLRESFQDGFNLLNGTLEDGFFLIGTQLNDISREVESLGAAFSYGINLLAQQLEVQSELMNEMLKRLDGIHTALENPTLTLARDFFNQGRNRLRKGLLDKALEVFLKAEEINDTDFLTQYSLGHLYLYGKNEDSNVINLEKAKIHFKNASRFSRVDIPDLPDARKFCGLSYFHLSIANYVLANEKFEEGNADEIKELLIESQAMAKNATEVFPQLTESFYQHAKVGALLGDVKASISSLKNAIEKDRNYCLKVDIDKDFDAIRTFVIELFEILNKEAAKSAKLAIEGIPALSEYIALTKVGKQKMEELYEYSSKAKSLFQSGTYFDYLDAINISIKARNIILKKRETINIVTKKEFEFREKRRQEAKIREEKQRKKDAEIIKMIEDSERGESQRKKRGELNNLELKRILQAIFIWPLVMGGVGFLIGSALGGGYSDISIAFCILIGFFIGIKRVIKVKKYFQKKNYN